MERPPDTVVVQGELRRRGAIVDVHVGEGDVADREVEPTLRQGNLLEREVITSAPGNRARTTRADSGSRSVPVQRTDRSEGTAARNAPLPQLASRTRPPMKPISRASSHTPRARRGCVKKIVGLAASADCSSSLESERRRRAPISDQLLSALGENAGATALQPIHSPRVLRSSAAGCRSSRSSCARSSTT